MTDKALLLFKPSLPQLSKNESKVLKLLIEAGKLIAPVYLEQEKQTKKDIDTEEIEQAVEKDPAILSPYTVIERVNGKLEAIPYHVKYARLLKPVITKLTEAADTTNDKEFENALRVQAKALIGGTYDQAIITWLKTKPYILNISIGPLYHIDNRLPFSKASYHAWVGVLDAEGTNKLNNYKKITLSARRKAFLPGERIEPKTIKAKILNIVLFSGIMAITKFVGINLPMNIDVVEKYGSEITLFNEANDLRVDEQIFPMFRKIFPRAFKEGFSWEGLRKGYISCTAVHELAHSYLYYKDAAKNLQDLFPPLYELAATILGLRMGGALLLQDRITEKQLTSMMVAYICRCYYLMSKGSSFMRNYSLGGMIFLNFMQESGAIKQLKSELVPNFMKIFMSLQELSYALENLLASGAKTDAESFIQKYTHKA